MAKVSLRAYNQEIETMIDRGHLDEAIAHSKHILKTFPKHLDTYRLLGKAYLEYKRHPEAADIFSRVLVSVPSDFVANVGMSIIRDEENKLDDAIWHMERAFETQPSNAAIQGELQRLYGRREGVQPPRIRMTRGGLAHMYVQGELYPQAISEIKSVLKEDPGRNDMQTLLARAYYRSGLKNDAAEVASTVLRSNPYNFDANRVLVEILSVDRPESVHVYRQRVVEMDPYAAQVTGSIFSSGEVPDAAVSLEHLDWNGQPVGMQPDWEAKQAISLESHPQREEQPDWLKSPFNETPATASPFNATTPSAKPAEPADEIPDFLRAAGWGESTGAFDESKPAFAEEESVSGGAPIEQGDLPDWVKAMAPSQQSETPAEEEELPDWINNLGASSLPTAKDARDQVDWMDQLNQPSAQPAEEQPDWLKGLDSTEEPAAASSEEQPDWLKGFDGETSSSDTSPGELDWLSQFGEGSEAKQAEPTSNEFDFLNQSAGLPETAESMPAEASLFAEQAETASASTSSDEFDFLNEFADEHEQLAPAFTESAASEASAAPLGMSAEEQDDAFAWLENLAAKQGATEGLLTNPEERLEEEPDWIKQAKSAEMSQPPAGTEQTPVTESPANGDEFGKSKPEREDSFAWLESLAAEQGADEGLLTNPEETQEVEPEWIRQAKSIGAQPEEVQAAETPEEEESVISEPMASLDGLGKSEQEQDDGFAWLESLAAKQGASEGLLTKPEERREEEPEWVKHAKDVSAQQPTDSEAVAEEPTTMEDVERETGQPDQEAQAASAQAEEQAEVPEVPDWLKQSQEVQAEEPSAADETRVWLRSLEQEETTAAAQAQEQPEEEKPEWMQGSEALTPEASSLPTPETEPIAAKDDTAAWLESLDEEAAQEIPEATSADETAVWFKSLEETESVSPEPAQAQEAEGLPGWMQDIEEVKTTDESMPATSEPSAEAAESTEWMQSIEEQSEPAAQEPPKVETGSLPSWLRGLDEEEEKITFAAGEELPSWLRDESGEVVVEPTKIEPTRPADWHPAETKPAEPEPAIPEPAASTAEPEPAISEVASTPEPEPMDVVAMIEEKITTSPQQPEEATSPAEPRREPPARKVTGTLTDPVLGQARGELSRNNVSVALENYDRLIKKGRFLEDVIYDLREALYRYPVDVSIWQSLGDAYMRSNRLQDALDAYTKAEELLR